MISYLLIMLFFVLLVCLFQFEIHKKSKLKHFTILPNAVPFLGHVYLLLGSSKKIFERFHKISRNFESSVTGYIGPFNFVILYNPEDIEVILNKAVLRYSVYKYIDQTFGPGIAIESGDKWKRNKKILTSKMSTKMLNTFLTTFIKNSNKLVQRLKENSILSLDELFLFIGTANGYSLIETTMGYDANEFVKPDEYNYWVSVGVRGVFERIFQMQFKSDFIFGLTKFGKEYFHSVKKLKEVTQKIIAKKKNDYMASKLTNTQIPENKKVLLDVLIEMSDSESINDEDLRGFVGVLMGAGTDTTSSTLSFLLIAIAINKDIQDKIYNEVMSVIGENRQVEMEDLAKLVNLERAIKETLRFTAPPFFIRRWPENIQLKSGKIIPKDCIIFANARDMHFHPKYFDEPFEFNPDRFTPEEIEKRPPGAYVPFASGPRSCVGQKFGMISMKVVLGYVIRKYKISTRYKHVSEIPMQFGLVVKPVGKEIIIFEERKH